MGVVAYFFDVNVQQEIPAIVRKYTLHGYSLYSSCCSTDYYRMSM